MVKGKPNIIFQFRFELVGIEPMIWRCVHVPPKYNFWDLHVAIQDSMGWLGYHLHAFRVRMPHKRKLVEIGIPTDDYYDEPVLPGWEIPITEYFMEPGKSAPFEYDFGDGWNHNILLEDAYKLDDVRDALRRGDIEAANKLARVFKLTPVSTAIPPEDKSFQSDPR
jgi:hypothetical protein